jgi:hypothetical protein
MMDFGQALRALKEGKRVARKGWNGTGMWLKLQKPDANSKMTLPYVYIEYPVNPNHHAYPNGSRCPWLASQTDMLSEDWFMLPDEKEEEPKQEPREAKEKDKEDKLAKEIEAIIRSIVEEDDTNIEVRVIHVRN